MTADEKKCRLAKDILDTDIMATDGYGSILSNIEGALEQSRKYKQDRLTKKLDSLWSDVYAIKKKLDEREVKLRETFHKKFGKDEEFWDDADANCGQFPWWFD